MPATLFQIKTPEKRVRDVVSTRKAYEEKRRDFRWPEIFVRFEKHSKVISGAVYGTVFGAEKFSGV